MKSVCIKIAAAAAVALLILVPAFSAYAEDGEIEMLSTSAETGLGEVIEIYDFIADEGKTPEEYSYSSDNESVAVVDSGGACEGVGNGEANITLTRTVKTESEGEETETITTATFTVTVNGEPSGVRLSAHKIALAVGKKYDLNFSISRGSSYKKSFMSDNADIAAVDGDGVITAKAAGTAEITLSTYNGKTDSCTVVVTESPSKLIIRNKNTKIQKGSDIHKILYKFAVGGASDVVKFSTSDSKIFKVDHNGYIKGVKKGKAVVRLKTSFDNVYAEQTLTVVDSSLKLNYNSAQLALDRTNVTRVQYGKSVKGNFLEAYIITNAKTGKYKKTLFIDFAVHGFEDSYAHDGLKLVEEANKLIKYFAFHSEELGKYRLVIVPCANPDGTISGKNNLRACRTAYGRCTAKHIDMNRDFGPFKAVESRKLRDYIKKCKPNVYLNMHGWLNETLGTKKLAMLINKTQGLPKYIDSYGQRSNYIIAWVHTNLKIPAALVEYKAPNKISTKKDINMIKQIIKVYK